jgi:hypothetical protein
MKKAAAEAAWGTAEPPIPAPAQTEASEAAAPAAVAAVAADGTQTPAPAGDVPSELSAPAAAEVGRCRFNAVDP